MRVLRRVPGLRRGLALLEVVIVVATLGVLVGLAAPPYREFGRKALATKVASDVREVQRSALKYYSDNGRWPARAESGHAPQEIASLLANMPWATSDYQLAFEIWPTPGGVPPRSRGNFLVGVTVVTPDPRLGVAILDALGSDPRFSYGNRYTLVVTGL